MNDIEAWLPNGPSRGRARDGWRRPGAGAIGRSVICLAGLVLAACGGDGGGRGRPPLVVEGGPAPAPQDREPAAGDKGFVGVVVGGESVAIEPKVEARVLEILVEPGQRVEHGQALARLDGSSLGHELRGARAALFEARRRYWRRRKLARGPAGAVTAEEVDAARRDVAEQVARVQTLGLAVAETNVTSPFVATVVERYLAAGALAGPGRPVLRLFTEGAPRIRFAVPEDRAAELQTGATIDVRVAASAALLRGRVTSVSPEVDAASRMVFAAADLEAGATQASKLATGLMARVFVATDRSGGSSRAAGRTEAQ